MKKLKITELVERFERDNEIKQLAEATQAYYRVAINYFCEWLPKSVRTTAKLTQTLFEDYTYYVVKRVENRTRKNPGKFRGWWLIRGSNPGHHD